MAPLLLAIFFIAIGYFIILRPQQERLRAQKQIVESLAVGDRVITAGGIHATITDVADETVRIAVAPNVELTLARPAIARRLDPETSSTEHDFDESVTGTPGDLAEDNVVNDSVTNPKNDHGLGDPA